MVLIRNLWLLLLLSLALPMDCAKAQVLPDLLAQQSTQTTEESNIGTIAERAVGLLATQQYEEVRSTLHPDLKEAITAEEIQQQWQQLLQQRGAFRRIVNTRPAQLFDGSLVLVTAAFERGSEDLIVLFNDQQQIVGFDILQLNDNIQEMAEAFVDALAAGDYALARRNFHSTLKTSVFPADLERDWQTAQVTNGQFQRRLSSEVTRGISTDVVQINVEFGNTTNNILVAFKSGRIAGFDFP
jgi:hypothetical protein